ncbi:hypothetical protein COU01_04125 [Candidatus Falkowbacteria bacterium CG10_big_fil_rev_8_21_14_0_10_44_15]|uniref:HEPN AbiU2-like domain-containing protein n=1 Tax=Candidatus Falkowbacteria bacterium CG10_big_fil_rev_8_21_14_0_10_44_15 TaxID=1974569 RepID=A0A2H0UYU3_9BACT|nr:MAG: hypothetical protein COU01_04125 [Candidatus Falkowbacteria bacterium CG10_big_fil_rev_8_21_14_0_10_44_15]
MKEQIDYFRGSIFEAKSAYNAWKMIVFSCWYAYVGKDLAEKYVKVQQYHKDFFGLAERSFLFHWVILVLHCFDDRKDVFSLKKVASKNYNAFIKDTGNAKVLKNLKNVRNTLLAHRSKTIKSKEVGSVEELDTFWKNLENFYNTICHDFDKSKTLFNNTENVKHDIENLFYNLERGENVRKNEIDIEWLWRKNPKRISNIL